MALAEDAVGKIRREVETGGERSLRLREEPCGEEQAEIIGGGTDSGKRIIVVDIISAGIGDRVIITTGSSARRMLGNDDVPVDAVVVGIIDEDCNFE